MKTLPISQTLPYVACLDIPGESAGRNLWQEYDEIIPLLELHSEILVIDLDNNGGVPMGNMIPPIYDIYGGFLWVIFG